MRWFGAFCLFLISVRMAAAQNNGGDSGYLVVGLLLIVAALAIYFLPAIIGSRRGLSSQGALFFVNLLFGWTVLGWLLCFIWAATGATRAQDAFFEKAAAQPSANPTADRAYQEAYARERARLDHEEQLRARGKP